jgi:peroxiredoxin
MAVELGEEAPDFELPNQHRQPVRLSDFRGRKNVVLVFYALAFTPTCSGEISALRDEGDALDNDDVQLLAVSCDPTSALKVFAEHEGVGYHLLSDLAARCGVSRLRSFPRGQGIRNPRDLHHRQGRDRPVGCGQLNRRGPRSGGL